MGCKGNAGQSYYFVTQTKPEDVFLQPVSYKDGFFTL